MQSVVSVTMREEDGNELEYQDELVSGDQTARLIRRDELRSSKNACGERSTTSVVARVVCSCRRCLQREPHSNRSYDEDDTWKDSGPPYTVFVASTKKYDFVRRVGNGPFAQGWRESSEISAPSE